MRDAQRDQMKRKKPATREYRTEKLDVPKPVTNDHRDARVLQLGKVGIPPGEMLEVPKRMADGRTKPGTLQFDKMSIPPASTRGQHLLRIGLPPIMRITADCAMRRASKMGVPDPAECREQQRRVPRPAGYWVGELDVPHPVTARGIMMPKL